MPDSRSPLPGNVPFYINNNVLPVISTSERCLAPCAQGWLSPTFIHPDSEGSCEVFPADSHTTGFPQLPMAQPQQNTEPLHPVCISQQADGWMCRHLPNLSNFLDFQVYRTPVDVEKVGRDLLFVLSSSARIRGRHMILASDKLELTNKLILHMMCS